MKFVYVALATLAVYGLCLGYWTHGGETLITIADMGWSKRSFATTVFFLVGIFASWK